MGGVLGDIHIRRPFEVAFFLYIVSTVYGALFVPTSTQGDVDAQKHPASGFAAFFAPLKIIRPHRYRLTSGQVVKNYGLVFLALGIFLGVVSYLFLLARIKQILTSLSSSLPDTPLSYYRCTPPRNSTSGRRKTGT